MSLLSFWGEPGTERSECVGEPPPFVIARRARRSHPPDVAILVGIQQHYSFPCTKAGHAIKATTVLSFRAYALERRVSEEEGPILCVPLGVILRRAREVKSNYDPVFGIT